MIVLLMFYPAVEMSIVREVKEFFETVPASVIYGSRCQNYC